MSVTFDESKPEPELAKAREQLEQDRVAIDGLKREPRLVKVRALKNLVEALRLQRRKAGEEFRVHEEEAARLEARGEAEIL